MKKIGKILRSAKSGPGLLIIEGQQFPFSVPGAWRSEQPAVSGVSVEVEFSAAGEILAIRPLSEIPLIKSESRASRIFGWLLASIRSAPARDLTYQQEIRKSR